VGVGVRHSLFPGYRHLALVSFRGSPAAGFPTLISIASGVSGLLAGPSVRLPITAYWVRLLRYAWRRSLAMRRATTRTSACKGHQISALNPGSAPAGDGTLAAGDGSYLLPLMLPFLCSQASRFSVRLKQEVLSDLARTDPLPVSGSPFRASNCESEPSGGVVPPEIASTCRFPVATQTLWVTGLIFQVETIHLGMSNSGHGWFLHGVPLAASSSVRKRSQVRPRLEGWVKYAFRKTRSKPNQSKEPGHRLSLAVLSFPIVSRGAEGLKIFKPSASRDNIGND